MLVGARRNIKFGTTRKQRCFAQLVLKIAHKRARDHVFLIEIRIVLLVLLG